MHKQKATAVLEHGGQQTGSAGSVPLSCEQYSTGRLRVQQPRDRTVSAHVWYRRLTASRHMLRQPLAWLLDVDELQAAEDAGARLVRIWDQDSRTTHWTTVNTLCWEGFYIERGLYVYLALAVEHWSPTMRDALDTHGGCTRYHVLAGCCASSQEKA